ncbi:PD-(D/E)XK nuclease superfamily protein [Lutibacter agarilyticus]|uniref:PD-(D/E)XK nuclease superfamily protein n=1 Tax=Lutibacter agarilyticus TaxID=1109740 RepID=A0A238VZT9_9FLAO|nr:PD-(D/E)XK nuclease family protein [Lutibacter agarilyticus]SNR39403.1 PD-(D/E)XK nuclease superfamily protein [Lutibacter agarilyticus]
MNSFISNVVEEVLKNHKNLNEVTFVLPSQRACVFLKEELLTKISTTAFLPKIESIENYIQELADLHLIDNTQLLFEFYSIYKATIPKDNLESFEAFSQWATIALHDFNDIDCYLVNTKDFFENLKDIKKLDKWFQEKKPSKLAVNYLHFFENLNVLYSALYDSLKTNKVGYQGLIYKEATENLEFYINSNSDKKIVFIGFNALNKAEEYIFQELLNNGIATVYWDANERFFKKSNEAGVFLRKYKSEWLYYKENEFLWAENSFNQAQNIHLIGAPKNITQIKYAGELLSKFDNFSKTALVLADENLLTLTLNSLPSNINNINITMGYPLKDMPLAGLFNKLFKMHLNQLKFNKKTTEFYYKDVLSLLNDPFLNKLYTEKLQKIISKINKENRIFLTLENLKNGISKEEQSELSIVFSLFSLSTDTNKIIAQCSALINALKPFVEGVEKEYLFRFYNVFQQLETLNTTYNHIENLKTLTLFYGQLLQNEKLSFQGEPLRGLQLMGMLETRALDFDTVVITSVNEGILPGGKNEFSFIPYDVKKYFDLPTYQEKDAIFSYHFQRLLQRAKNIYLIYNTETDGYGSGEKSRFLTQLEINNPAIIKTIISPKVQPVETKLLEVEKTPAIIQKLKEVFTAGISPSALANYIYNPISFYEQKVLGIREDDEVEETIAANTMGSVIHDVLEHMYKPFIGKFLTKDNIAAMQKSTIPLLNTYFEKHYFKGNIQTGKNKLIFEVSKSYIDRFLNQELQILNQKKELKIIALEGKLNCEIVIEGVDFPIKLRGIVDRVDELDGVTRIIDYKTGKVESGQLKMTDFSVISEDYKYTKAMQVMLYAYMFLQTSNNEFNELESGIISFKNLRAGFMKMNFSASRGQDNHVSEERIADFMLEIKKLIVEILNPELPFKQNQDLPF